MKKFYRFLIVYILTFLHLHASENSKTSDLVIYIEKKIKSVHFKESQLKEIEKTSLKPCHLRLISSFISIYPDKIFENYRLMKSIIHNTDYSKDKKEKSTAYLNRLFFKNLYIQINDETNIVNSLICQLSPYDNLRFNNFRFLISLNQELNSDTKKLKLKRDELKKSHQEYYFLKSDIEKYYEKKSIKIDLNGYPITKQYIEDFCGNPTEIKSTKANCNNKFLLKSGPHNNSFKTKFLTLFPIFDVFDVYNPASSLKKDMYHNPLEIELLEEREINTLALNVRSFLLKYESGIFYISIFGSLFINEWNLSDDNLQKPLEQNFTTKLIGY